MQPYLRIDGHKVFTIWNIHIIYTFYAKRRAQLETGHSSQVKKLQNGIFDLSTENEILKQNLKLVLSEKEELVNMLVKVEFNAKNSQHSK